MQTGSFLYVFLKKQNLLSDSYFIQVVVYATLGFTLLVLAIVLMLILQARRRNKYQAEKREREYQYQNELLNMQLELQEHLLNQVSQEIHDNVGQVLSLVKVHLYSVSSQPAHQRSLGLLETSASLLDKAIEDLRNISHAQSTTIVERLGLKEAISKELGYIKALKKQECALAVLGDHYSLLPEQELFIYRIAQEAIINSIKHAKGAMLNVTLDYQPALFILSVTDNGVGFDPLAASTKPGIGITHMQQRAKLLRGEIHIASQQNIGTTVTLKIPVNL